MTVCSVLLIHCLLHEVTLTSRATARAQLVTQRTPVAQLLLRMTAAEKRALAAQEEQDRRQLGGALHRRSVDARPPRARQEEGQSIREKYKQWKMEFRERLST